MDIVVKLFSAGLLIWFALLAMLITIRVLRGDIETIGLLTESAGSSVTPERVVAVAVFPTILIGYTITALHAAVSGPHPQLPDIPESVVALLTGSNSLYLAGKITRTSRGAR